MERLEAARLEQDRPRHAHWPPRTPGALDQFIRRAPVAARPILGALAAAQTRHRLFVSGPVVVAVSGGADSAALLHALAGLAPFWGLTLHVAHVDHGLRPESAADAAFVARLAAAYGLAYHQVTLAPAALHADPQGVEAAARQARYAFLRRVAHQVGTPAPVVTAHHQDDQAETLLLHLIQGSGPTGLAGMGWVGCLPDAPTAPAVPLLRPLLGTDRAGLRAYLAAYGLEWREDATNADLGLVRNRLRAEVLPALAALNPNIAATLARSADLLAAEADFAAQRDTAALAAVTLDAGEERRVLDLDRLDAYPLAVQRGLLQKALAELGLDRREVGFAHVEAVLDRARTHTGGGPYPLVAGWSWTLLGPSLGVPARLSIHKHGALPVYPDHPHVLTPLARPQPLGAEGVTVGAWRLWLEPGAAPSSPTRDAAGEWQVELDGDAAGQLWLTTPHAGMKVAPLGMGGQHKRLGDLFTDRKIAPALRPGWPIVVDAQGEIVWVCGLCLADSVRRRPTTRRTVTLKWTHNIMSNES